MPFFIKSICILLVLFVLSCSSPSFTKKTEMKTKAVELESIQTTVAVPENYYRVDAAQLHAVPVKEKAAALHEDLIQQLSQLEYAEHDYAFWVDTSNVYNHVLIRYGSDMPYFPLKRSTLKQSVRFAKYAMEENAKMQGLQMDFLEQKIFTFDLYKVLLLKYKQNSSQWKRYVSGFFIATPSYSFLMSCSGEEDLDYRPLKKNKL